AESLAKGELETRTAQRAGILGAGISEDVLDTTENIVAMSLEFAADNASIRIIIDAKGQAGGEHSLRVLNKTGSGITGFLTPDLLNNHKADLFDTLVFDQTGMAFKFGLKRNLQFPAGVRIRVQNPNGTDHNAGVNIIYVVKRS